jgi:hypothetical protein
MTWKQIRLMPSDAWLDAAEDCVLRAVQQANSAAALETALTHLSTGRANLPLKTDTLKRLAALRQQATALQAVARYRLALHVGLDQLDQTSIIGYSPTGLERAL